MMERVEEECVESLSFYSHCLVCNNHSSAPGLKGQSPQPLSSHFFRHRPGQAYRPTTSGQRVLYTLYLKYHALLMGLRNCVATAIIYTGNAAA